MGQSTQFILGSSVSCSDGPGGELTRIVVDPVPRTVTHLVVKPPQRGEAAAGTTSGPRRTTDGAAWDWP